MQHSGGFGQCVNPQGSQMQDHHRLHVYQAARELALQVYAVARDLCGFLGMALGSARELEFQLDLCERAALVPVEPVTRALETTKRVQQMLTRLIVKIRARDRE